MLSLNKLGTCAAVVSFGKTFHLGFWENLMNPTVKSNNNDFIYVYIENQTENVGLCFTFHSQPHDTIRITIHVSRYIAFMVIRILIFYITLHTFFKTIINIHKGYFIKLRSKYDMLSMLRNENKCSKCFSFCIML